MAADTQHQVWFLPWLGVPERLEVGPVTFEPWATMNAPDHIRAHLDAYFRCYKDRKGQPREVILVARVGSDAFRSLDAHERRLVRTATDILVFAATGEGLCDAINGGFWRPPSGDRFELIGQGFVPGRNLYAQETDVLIADDFDEINFVEPFVSAVAPDLAELPTIASILGSRIGIRLQARLSSVLEWFRMAQTHSLKVPEKTQVVLLATALEILFDLPDGSSKAPELATRIDELFATPAMRFRTRVLRKRKKPRRVQHTPIGWWAYDYYKLRNEVVHSGQLPKRLSKTLSQGNPLDVATTLIYVSVLRQLMDKRIWPSDVTDYVGIFGRSSPSVRSAPAAELFLLFGKYKDVFRELDWLPRASR